MWERIFGRTAEIRGTIINENRTLENEFVHIAGGVVSGRSYLEMLREQAGLVSYQLETTRSIVRSEALQGNWDREGSIRKADDMEKEMNFEWLFLNGKLGEQKNV